MEILCLVFVLLFRTLCQSRFAKKLEMEERTGCFTLTVYLMSYGTQCSGDCPRGAVGLSVVCDCGISWTYSLAFLSDSRQTRQ